MKADNDKLAVKEVWMPCGLFAPSRHGSFVPLGYVFRYSSLIQRFVMKKQESLLEKAWRAALPWLRSPDVINVNSFTAPWLDYDPYLKNSGDVYFLLDEINNPVKIGVTNNLRQRYETLLRQVDAEELSLVSIIPHGGAETESALHRIFSIHRVEAKGLGREWFY